MTTIIFVRHGETLWNKERRYQGQKDSPLSPKGLLQAEKAGEFLRDRKIHAVYCSDLKRALVTAESIAKHHQLRPTVDVRLREMSFGVWEGQTREEVRLQYPDLWKARGQDIVTTRIPEGELPEEVVQRFRGFLDSCLAKAPNQTIVVVSHGGALRLTIASLLHIPLNKASCLHQSNTGITELIFTNKSPHVPWEAVCINCTGHLG